MANQLALVCEDRQQRRSDVLDHPTLNGIDYVEVDADDHTRLRLHLLKPVPPADILDPNDTDDGYGLSADPGRATITGGARVVGIRVTDISRRPDGSLELITSAGGDYSTYRLELDASEVDPYLRAIDFSFMAACPVEFDCKPERYCPPADYDEPSLDYQSKDYASFRRLMLDLLPHLNPNWTERNPSDLGMALVEILAYTGDQLSYFQDAVANEAFLESARRRISARRHARLVDYRTHDGRNAWTFVHLQVSAAATLAAGTPFVTRVFAPLANEQDPPGTVLDSTRITVDTLRSDPALECVTVLESTHPGRFDPRNNEIEIHTFGNQECCLRPGSREAYLYSVSASGQARRPDLRRGDYLLLEEVRGPVTGLRADADAKHRQVVRIDVDPEETEDPVYRDALDAETLELEGRSEPIWALRRREAGDDALPLLRVRWRREDAVRFPLCLSARRPSFDLVPSVSVARGNMVLVDHGLTTTETASLGTPVPGGAAFRLELDRANAPVTLQAQPERVNYDPATARMTTPRWELDADPADALPSVAVVASFPAGVELWTPVRDLLDSPPFAQHFVAEIDDDGRAILRFGDGEYGREMAGATSFQAVYRVGNGSAGNVGADTVGHVALPGPTGWIRSVRNPLAATGGVDPETIEEVRRRAPQAFRARQYRAVVEADYAAAAEQLPEVAGAVASFRWTGSWYTVFVGIDPAADSDLVRRPLGRTRLASSLERRVRTLLGRYRLAGYDLEIRPPVFVPLELELELCAKPDHFRADVAEAVLHAFSTRVLPNGTRGFFHPDRFTFGDSVYLSRVYAAVEAVEGVDSVVVRVFKRADQRDNGELLAGVIRTGPWEIPILDNDPNFMENGVLRLTARGGKA